MLFLKSRNELTADDVRAFCHRFDEGIRVEYKRDFGDGVRSKLPKTVSSFANSHGGALIVGVRTKNGKPVDPIQGFDRPSQEELALTVEHICHQNIYPVLTPLITEVQSDVKGKVFLIMEVDPSPEAPHAIENSRKVYIRTGSGTDLTDLADIDTVERLIKRRENLLRQRQRFESELNEFVQRFAHASPYPKVRVIVGPRYPHTQLSDREKVFRFLRDTRFRSGHFYRRNELRRVPQGVCGTRSSDSFGYVDTFGHICHEEVVTCQAFANLSRYETYDLIHPILQGLYCSSRLYQAVGYRGEVSIEVRAHDMLGHVCIWGEKFSSEELVPPTPIIHAWYTVASESLEDEALNITTGLTHQLLWPMKLGDESITEDHVRRIVHRIMNGYNP